MHACPASCPQGPARTPAADDATITGITHGIISKVLFTRGDCQVESQGMLGISGLFTTTIRASSSCWQISEPDLPRYSPRWTCGLRFRGSTDCVGQQGAGEEGGGMMMGDAMGAPGGVEGAAEGGEGPVQGRLPI
jgi:hypothetical protein